MNDGKLIFFPDFFLPQWFSNSSKASLKASGGSAWVPFEHLLLIESQTVPHNSLVFPLNNKLFFQAFNLFLELFIGSAKALALSQLIQLLPDTLKKFTCGFLPRARQRKG